MSKIARMGLWASFPTVQPNRKINHKAYNYKLPGWIRKYWYDIKILRIVMWCVIDEKFGFIFDDISLD